MKVIDCKTIRNAMIEEAKVKVQAIGSALDLIIIQVAGDDASDVYVRNKIRWCLEAGINPELVRLKSDASFEELSQTIKSYNGDPEVTGVMLQLPLPKHLKPRQRELLDLISYEKDVDGLSSSSMGRLWAGMDCIKPATPSGIMRLLPEDLSGKNATIIGRSDLVGKPLSKMLMDRNATVTLCHSRTKDLHEHLVNADIVVSAVGRAGFLREETHALSGSRAEMWIDVGINRDAKGRLCGDIKIGDLENMDVSCTPVPGGVGILTTAQLVLNVIEAHALQNEVCR